MRIPLPELHIAFLKIGCTSFGASASQAIFDELVEKRRWLGEDEFREIFSLSSLSPGPFHVNLVNHLGYKIAGVRGMLAALAGFVGPSLSMAILVVTCLSMQDVKNLVDQNPGVLPGVLAGISALLLSVIVKLGKPLVRHRWHIVAIFVLSAALIVASLSPFVAVLAGGLAALAWRAFNGRLSDRQ